MSKRVVVLGATGRVGSVTVDLALADGFFVTAIARNPSKIGRVHHRLAVLEGDTTDRVSLLRALERVAGQPDGETQAGETAPTIVMAIGADPLKPSTLVGDTVTNLVELLPTVGIHRYVGVSGVAQMPATPVGRLTQTAIRRGVKAAADHQRAYDRLVDSDLDWVVAGCPYIKDGHPAGRALEHTAPFPGGYRVISPRDVAIFIVRHLHDNSRHREIIGLW